MALLDVFKGKKDKLKLEKKDSLKKESVLTKTKKEKAVKMKKAVNVYSVAHRILQKPIISEKAANLNVANKYVFSINKNVSKTEVFKAVKAVYGVRPIKVNIINISGKGRKYGRTIGRTSDKKKAIVTLPIGTNIQVYEGV